MAYIEVDIDLDQFDDDEFYGRYVPPCPRCGYPELKTREEYYKAMGIKNV